MGFHGFYHGDGHREHREANTFYQQQAKIIFVFFVQVLCVFVVNLSNPPQIELCHKI